MELIVIGKPALNIYLPLEEFPQEGDIFTITGKNESIGNVGATSACLIAKWGIKPHFAGVIGNDKAAEKIRNTFAEYKINTKFVEANYEYPTSSNYFILNKKSGITTKILFNNPKAELSRYKYDFIPDYAILDGTDLSGTMALINDFPNCIKVLYCRTTQTRDIINYSKKVDWNVTTESFAIGMTNYHPNGTNEDYVNLYQKLVDLGGKSNYIVILNNHKILFCENGKVKLLPEMKINVADNSSFDSIFVGAFTFGLMNKLNLDDSIKLANTAAAMSLAMIGEEPSIPVFNDVLLNSGLGDRFNKSGNNQANVNNQVNNQVQVNNQTMSLNNQMNVNNVEMPVANNNINNQVNNGMQQVNQGQFMNQAFNQMPNQTVTTNTVNTNGTMQ